MASGGWRPATTDISPGDTLAWTPSPAGAPGSGMRMRHRVVARRRVGGAEPPRNIGDRDAHRLHRQREDRRHPRAAALGGWARGDGEQLPRPGDTVGPGGGAGSEGAG